MSLSDLVQSKGQPTKVLPEGAASPDYGDYHEGKTIYINESGLYAVAMKSCKPVAEPFFRWVTNVVLPSIRRSADPHAPMEGALAFRKRLLEDVRAVVQKEIQENHAWNFSKRSRSHRDLEEIGQIVRGSALRELDEREHIVRITDFLQDRITNIAWRLHGRKFKNIFAASLKSAKIKQCREEGLQPPVTFNQGEHRIVYTEADSDLMVQVLAACRDHFEKIAAHDAPIFRAPRAGQRSIVEFMQPREPSDDDGLLGLELQD